MFYYSKKTGGFYLEDIHGDNMPEDVVEVSDEYHAELMDGQRNGNIIAADEKGFPRLVPIPEPDDETKKAIATKRARQYLNSTDWYVVRFTETGVPIPVDVSEKRAAARAAIVE